jgi:hypothetical protein
MEHGCGVDRFSKMTLSSLQAQARRGIFIRLLTVELHWKDKEKTGLPGLPIEGPVKTAK